MAELTQLQQDKLKAANEMLLRRSKEVIKAEKDYKDSRYMSNNFKDAKNKALNNLHKSITNLEELIHMNQQNLF